MLEYLSFELTAEQVCEYAKYNVRWFTLAGLAYCRDMEQSPKEYWRYFGRIFADNWRGLKTTQDIAFVVAANLRSFGMDVHSIEGDGRYYVIKVSGVPTESELEYFDLRRRDTDAAWDIFKPILDSLDHDYTWRRSGDAITFEVFRR